MQKKTIPSGEIDERAALLRAQSLCSQRECCVSQIQNKLQAWGQTEAAQERIICQLINERYIDERRFACAYAHDKLRYNQWGRIKIGQMLRLLGISSSDRSEALSQLPEDEYQDILHRLITDKKRSTKARSDYELRAKIVRFMLGKGFEQDLVMDALDDVE